MSEPVLGFKGFDLDLTCRTFQFKVGETYHHEGEVIACKSGFHFCKELKDVFQYYSYAVYCRVVGSGKVHTEEDKTVAETIHIVELLQGRFESGGHVFYFDKGRLHRDEDLPAMELAGGSKIFCQNGVRHRDYNLPAEVWADGTRCYFQHGVYHRGGILPAVEFANGEKIFYKKGELIRHKNQYRCI
jgi:hypothetical protein